MYITHVLPSTPYSHTQRTSESNRIETQIQSRGACTSLRGTPDDKNVLEAFVHPLLDLSGASYSKKIKVSFINLQANISVTGMASALAVIDVQYDFLPGGSLAVNDGDKILPRVYDLIDRGSWDLIVASQVRSSF